MKKIIFLVTLFIAQNVFANLYLTTEYQEAEKPPVVTKHHIFLNQKYPINYTKMAYSLTLTKLDKDHGTIESETFVIDQKGKKHLISGGIGNFTVGKPLALIQYSKTGKREFILRITPDRAVP